MSSAKIVEGIIKRATQGIAYKEQYEKQLWDELEPVERLLVAAQAEIEWCDRQAGCKAGRPQIVELRKALADLREAK